jgi:signal transduction histidine kinase
MLRRKLFVRLGLLVGVLLASAVGAIWLLQGVLADLDRVNADAAALVDGTQELSSALTMVEAGLYEDLQGGDGPGRGELKDAIAQARAAYAALGEHEITRGPGAAAGEYARVGSLLAEVLPAAESAAGGAQDPGAGRALGRSVALRREMLGLVRAARGYVTGERGEVVSRLRVMVIGMSLAALVIVNLAVLVLFRTAEMVLKPVGALVDASRELGRERFEYRVKLDQDDEFGELGRAYNSLAEQLAANEQRKMDTLRQTAVMLNHELNNVLAIVAMQLALADRQAGANALLKQHLQQVSESLSRVAQTVQALGRVQRIVLTDYLPGQKMLDLSRSVLTEDSGAAQEAQKVPDPMPRSAT